MSLGSPEPEIQDHITVRVIYSKTLQAYLGVPVGLV